jgi:hypothetical protein
VNACKSTNVSCKAEADWPTTKFESGQYVFETGIPGLFAWNNRYLLIDRASARFHRVAPMLM